MRNPQSHAPYLGILVMLVAGSLAALVSGCSSDAFSPTGTALPADVSQDSLLIPLNIVNTIGEVRLDLPILDPPQGESIELRELLYFGTLQQTDWLATPFVQYDFSGVDQALIDTLQVFPERILHITMSFRLVNEDSKRGDEFRFQLYELNEDLDRQMAEGPASQYLGLDMGQHTALRGQTFTTDLLDDQTPAEALAIKNIFLGWWEAGQHPGIALSDLTGDSSLVGLASRDFKDIHERLLAEQNPGSGQGEVFIIPRITMEYRDGESGLSEFLTVQSMADLAVLDRASAHPDLALGGYVVARTWMGFDLSTLPRASTINAADLVLHFDRSRLAVTGFPGVEVPYGPEDSGDDDLSQRSDGDRSFAGSTLSPISLTALVYEATLEQAEALDTSSLSQVRDALTTIRPDLITSGTRDGDDLLRVNITDFAQRVVNGIFGDDPPGLLLAVTQEELQIFEAIFFDSSAVDSLRPRLEVRYTPPADFVP